MCVIKVLFDKVVQLFIFIFSKQFYGKMFNFEVIEKYIDIYSRPKSQAKGQVPGKLRHPPAEQPLIHLPSW